VSRTRQQPKATPRKAFDTPVLVAGVIGVILCVLGAFRGFDVFGTLGSFPILILAIIVIFVIGATLTVRRSQAMRTDRPGSRQRPGV
jgi:uncharacterized membrane protein YhaH (DUF805 family)